MMEIDIIMEVFEKCNMIDIIISKKLERQEEEELQKKLSEETRKQYEEIRSMGDIL